MKKIILFLISFIFYTLIIDGSCHATDSKDFINNFANCSYYTANSENKIQTILGWATRKCYYREYTHDGVLTCGFKQLQLIDIAKMMKKTNFDYTQGILNLEGINKYINEDENLCQHKEN